MDGISLSCDRDEAGTAPLSEPTPSSSPLSESIPSSSPSLSSPETPSSPAPELALGDITTNSIASSMVDGKVEDPEGGSGGDDDKSEAEVAQTEYVVGPDLAGTGSNDPTDNGWGKDGEMYYSSAAAVVAIGSETDGGGVQEPDTGGQITNEDHVPLPVSEIEMEIALEAFIPVAPQPPKVLPPEDVQKYTDRRKLTRTMKIAISVLLILLVGTVVGLSVGLTRKFQRVATLAPTPNPDELLPSQIPTTSPAPSSSPTMFVTSITFPLVAEQVEKEFGPQSYQMLRQDPQSPQAKAARWIGDVDTWFNFPLPLDDAEQRRHFRQRYALATFFYSTGGEESWVDHVHFLSDRHECDWSRYLVIVRGTKCDASQTRVIGIKVDANNLTGSIPDEIWGVEDLKSLTLFSNGITGSIPDGFYSLSKLQIFHVPFNPLSGTISPLIGNMQNLTFFWTEKSRMEGTLPMEIGQLKQLESFWVVESTLTGTLPAEYSDLVNLRYMSLQSNLLTGTVPTWMADLPSLEHFFLGYNLITGPIPDGSYHAAKIISFKRNLLTGTLPESLLSPTLEKLHVDLNYMSGPLPRDWSTATNLDTFQISDNAFTGSLPKSLCLLTSLVYFYVRANQLTGPMVDLGNSTALEVLFVEGNNLTGTIPDVYSVLPIRTFGVGNTSLTGNLTDLCASVLQPRVRANCPPQVVCPCCTECYDGNAFVWADV